MKRRVRTRVATVMAKSSRPHSEAGPAPGGKRRVKAGVVSLAAPLAVVAAVGLGFWVARRAHHAPGPAGPHAAFDQLSLDLGRVLPEGGKTAMFTLRNDGSAPLHLSEVRGDCGCLTPEFPRVLAAGDKGRVAIRFQPSALQDGQVERHVRVATDDPR